MTEIKSAIELAMERTKGLHLSSEEREKLKQEEILAKARGLVNRFLQGDFHLRELKKKIAKLDPEEWDRLGKLMFFDFIDAIHLDQENDLVFEGIEADSQKNMARISEIRKLIESYRKSYKDEWQKVEEELFKKLKNMGIFGTAVIPRIEGSREWRNALAEFKPAFEDQLGKLKRELREGK